MAQHILRRLVPAAAGLALLLTAVPADAQGLGGSSGGSSGGSFGGSSGGSSGGSFGGSGGSSSGQGTSTSGFLGSSGSFLGSGSGTSSSTGITPGLRNTSGSTTSVGGTSFQGPSYGNPLALGYSGLATFDASSVNTKVVRSTTFGTAMFTITTPRAPANANLGAATLSYTVASPVYASSVGIRKAPSFVTEPRFRFAPPSLAAMESNARDAIVRSSRLESKGTIRVALDGPVVILSGSVLDPDERQLAEDLVRLTPGVRDVRNELTVRVP